MTYLPQRRFLKRHPDCKDKLASVVVDPSALPFEGYKPNTKFV